MYNKLFSKIVDSSIWLEPTATRLIWVMFIAVMDEDGFVAITSVANVAHKARVTEKEASEAIGILESPDQNSAPDEHEGRRVERVPGGWMVLNSEKYRNMVTREMIREQTRIRVARKRAKDKANVTQCNGEVTQGNDLVTPSRAVSEAIAEPDKETRVHVNLNNWLTKDDLWIELQRILPEAEVKKHVGLWIARIKENRAALYEAICDFKDKRNTRKIKNVGAWLTQRYQHFKKLLEGRPEVRELSAKLRDELKK